MGALRAVVVVALALVLPGGAAAQVPRAAACERPEHTKLLARDAQLRAWVRYGITSSVVDVCALPRGRVRQVWSSATDPHFNSITRVESATAPEARDRVLL